MLLFELAAGFPSYDKGWRDRRAGYGSSLLSEERTEGFAHGRRVLGGGEIKSMACLVHSHNIPNIS